MVQIPPVEKGFQRALIAAHASAADTDLFRYARMLALKNMIRDLRIVHVLPDPGSTLAADYDGVLANLKAETEKHLRGLPPSARVRHDLMTGPVIDRLLEYAVDQEVDLILLGHRKLHSLGRSLARRLAMKAPCSVWLVPEGSAPVMKRILVPIDFSHRAADALGLAAVLAAQAGVDEVTALHVYFDEARTTYEDADLAIRGREADAFRAFVAPLNNYGVKISPLFSEGIHPSDVIGRTSEATGTNLLVLATRGRSRSAAILLGSVAEQTLLESTVPVVVVKHFGARINVLQALLDRSFRRGPGLQFD